MGEEAASSALVTCYGPGSIAGAIIGTLLITLGLAGAALLLYNIYWRSRKGKHLVLVSDVENPDDHYAFDNPNFREATPIKANLSDDTKSGKLDLSWLGNWSPLHAFSTPRNENQRSLDDTYITDSEIRVVSLKSHDFTGLGFSVCGNMRDGIFVKDLLHRGPAFESGCINPGDRIESISISFRHMVFEDALTILSYASPYEVKIQVEHNTTSRPSTLLRKRETSGTAPGERILHPFYRSHSIADLTSIKKASDRRSYEKRNYQSHDTTDYATLKLSPGVAELKKEHISTEKRGNDAVDGSSGDPPKHPKFGVRVLPIVGFNNRNTKDHSENEQNSVIEQTITTNKSKDDDGKDVKTIITKGFQNLKEKINQNTLGRKKKDEENEDKDIVSEPNVQIKEELVTSVEVPIEVERAGAMAQLNRKSQSAESLAARRPSSQIIIQVSNATIDTDQSHKKSKGKAPAPPQTSKEPEPKDIIEESNNSNPSIFERQLVADSDSEAESAEMTCTQVTVHHSSVPVPEEPESGRKAASLGDLSRIDDQNYTATLERAVSLDLDCPGGKKRKAPQPPAEDFLFEEDGYRKEPRLEGYNTFQRRLKKSSDFGRLEDVINSDSESEHSIEKVDSSVILTDLNSEAANKIQEFSSWLEDVRKPQDQAQNHHITISNIIHGDQNYSNHIETENSEISEDHSPTMEPSFSRPADNSQPTDTTEKLITFVPLQEDKKISSEVQEIPSETNITIVDKKIHPLLNPTEEFSGHSLSEATDQDDSVRQENPNFTFSVNGFNLQDRRTVLLISQPNSLELDEIPESKSPDEEIPPQLPTSPPPSASNNTYVTEIHVTTPEQQLNSTKHPPPLKTKPVRKDLSPETSRIPIRTMKSETGQKVLAAIQSLASKELNKNSFEVNELKHGSGEGTVPNVAGFYLKKVPPAVPPRKSEFSPGWREGIGKERVNGTPRHVPVSSGVSFPVKTSGTKIVFESHSNIEEF